MIFAEVIGDPIAQSKSPLIHTHWLAEAGIEADYRRTPVDLESFDEWLESRWSDEDWRGANITMPLKLKAISAADEATDRAVTAGAANILIPREGKVVAGNSDVGAVMSLLAALHEAGRPMGRLHLYGNGGAARACLVALRSLNVNDVTIHARDRQKAVKLAVEFGLAREPVGMDVAPDGDGVINATPLGMAGHECLSCDLDKLNPDGWLFDLVSAPAKTRLLKEARARDLATVDGIDMLVEQAAASFTLFFGEEPKRQRDGELFAILRA